jgi:glycosyltransferase involved in cell wall biosynthesis
MITVAICTYNNAKKLAVALESLRGLLCPPTLDYEILVVDNNSHDETRQVIGRFFPLLGPRLRYVFEGAQGLSHARNRAMREARGDIVSYIDDDVQVDPGWLAAVAAAFEEHCAAVVGGRSHLAWPAQRPPWLPADYEFLLSRLDYGEQVIVNTDQDLFGLNFSVSKPWLQAVGGFDPALGRRGRALYSGEESDLLKRIREKGGIAVYEPRALVRHLVSPERVKRRWFVKRLFAAGKDSIAIAVKEGNVLPSVGGAALHAVRCCGGIAKSIVLGDFSSRNIFRKELVAIHALGRLWARVRLAVRPVIRGPCGA